MPNKKAEISADSFYQYQPQKSLVELSQTPCVTSTTKVTLFNEVSLSSQWQELNSLIQSINTPCLVRRYQTENNHYWELYFSVECFDLESFKPSLLEFIRSSTFDFLLWPAKKIEPPRLMLFDMDSTFIQIEVIDELARLHGVGDKVASVTEEAMQGRLDFSESLRTRVACLKGLSDMAISEVANNLPLSPGVLSLIAKAKKNNCAVAIVSGGFSPFVNKLKTDLNLYKVKANQLKIFQGKLTGDVQGEIVDAKAKAEFLAELSLELGISSNQIMAIGDGANDLLMMQAAGFDIAYQAKPKVAAAAKGRLSATHLGRVAEVFGW